MSTFRLRIVGYPMPQERGQVSKHCSRKTGKRWIVDPERSRGWKESVKLQALMRGRPTLLTGDLCMVTVFHLPRPKSVRRKRPGVKPDLKNLIWAIEDALEGIVFANDSQIVKQINEKKYADQVEPGVSIEICELGEED